MITLVIILFLLLMVAIWGHYGLFSAFMQLVTTIAAATLAIALWEPLVYHSGLLSTKSAEMVWGLALLVPFLFWIIVLRVAMDKLVRGNLDFDRLTNVIGGGFFGLLAGVLISGLTLIGVGFLPMSASIMGYRPLAVLDDGTVDTNEGGQLLLPVDKWVSSFYERLSSGSMSSSTPLGLYAPQLHIRHALFRLRVDPNSSCTAHPEYVKIIKFYIHGLPISTLDPQISDGLPTDRLDRAANVVILDTVFSHHVPPYDRDRNLRLSPTHVRLISSLSIDRTKRTKPRVDAPVAFVFADDKGQRHFMPIDRRDRTAFTAQRDPLFGWVFLVPEDHTPKFLLVRNLRMPVPRISDPDTETQERLVVNALGKPKEEEVATTTDGSPDAADKESPGQFEPGEGPKVKSQPVALTITDKLPKDIHRNKADLSFVGNRVENGEAVVKTPKFQLKAADRVKRLYVPANQACLRIRLERDLARSLLGKARTLAASTGGVFIRDSRNTAYPATGYILLHKGGNQTFFFRPQQPISAALQIPVDRLRKGDELYLYFLIPNNKKIVSYEVGQKSWDLSTPLEVR